MTAADREVLEAAQAFTMTSHERQLALIAQLRRLCRYDVPGAWTECGVWRGGSAMIMAAVALQEGAADRELWLYDTFAGMSEPTDRDVRWDGQAAAARREEFQTHERWTQGVSAVDVYRNLLSTGYPAHQLRLVIGKVEETLRQARPRRIALLRLDTDWYESTRAELYRLYPRLSSGGVLFLDDYGYWQGARQAVDEYLGGLGLLERLQRIDFSGRYLIKP